MWRRTKNKRIKMMMQMGIVINCDGFGEMG